MTDRKSMKLLAFALIILASILTTITVSDSSPSDAATVNLEAIVVYDNGGGSYPSGTVVNISNTIEEVSGEVYEYIASPTSVTVPGSVTIYRTYLETGDVINQITATFTASSTPAYTVTITTSPITYGGVTSSSITVLSGTTYSTNGPWLTFSDGQTVEARPRSSGSGYTYSFDHWSSTSGTITSGKSITAYFTRTAITYTVSFESNNTSQGTVSRSQITGVPYDSTVSINGNQITINGTTVTATPKSGYGFASWSRSSAGSVDANIKSNVTFYAAFGTSYSYSLSYNANGGSNAPSTQTASSVSNTYSFTVTSSTPTPPTGKTFVGWSTSSTATSASYTAGNTITLPISGSRSVTLYAVYATQTFTVTFESSNTSQGTVSSGSITTVPYGSTVSINNNQITINGSTVTATAKSGYGFTSWTRSAGNLTATITSNVKFTANFSTNYSYSLAYNANGGSNAPASQSATSTSTTYTFTISSSTPTAPVGKNFVGWSTSSTATSASYSAGGSITLPLSGSTRSVTLYAVYATQTFTVTFQSNNTSYGTVSSGSVSAVPYGSTVTISGNTVTVKNTTITATPGANYTFSTWSRSPGNLTATITSNVTFTANFAAATFFDVDIYPASNGTIKYNGTTVSSHTTYSIKEGTLITLTATPNTGYRLNEWQIVMVDASEYWYPTDTQIQFNVDMNYEVTASFITDSNTVTVSVNDSSYGSVSQGSITGIAYGTAISTSGNTLTIGSTTVTATPNYGYQFLRWNNAQGNVTGDRTITAEFEALQTYTVTFESGNTSQGTVSTAQVQSVARGTTITINDNQITINKPSPVTVTATPSSGYAFSSWTRTVGNLSDPITSNVTFTATFSTNYSYSLAYDANGGSNAPSTQTATSTNTTYTFTISSSTPTAPAGKNFVGWSTSSSATTASYAPGDSITLPISGSRSITLYAVYSSQTITVAFAPDNLSHGSVSQGSIPDVPYGTTISIVGNQITINTANPVTVTATPGNDYAFHNWTRTSGNITDPITSNVTFTANFVEATFFDVTIYPATHGTISYNGTTVLTTTTYSIKQGTNITLTAAADTGYRLNEWQIHMVENDEFFYPTDYPNLVWTVDADYEIVADFITDYNTVTIRANNDNYGSVSQTTIPNVPYLTPITTSGNTLTIGNTTVTATAAAGHEFLRWNNAQGNVTGDRTITAEFSGSDEYTVTFMPNNLNYGSVSQPRVVEVVSGTTISIVGNQITINKSIPETVTATANAGYTFLNWSRSMGNITAPITSNVTFTANFYETSEFDVTFYPSAHGTISVNGTEITTTTTLTYTEGTHITLLAEPDNGYWLQEWQIHMVENDEFFYPDDEELEWTVDADYEIVADFRTNNNTITINVNDSEYGYVSQNSISPVTYLTPIVTNGNTLTIGNTTVTATANTGYVFLRWNNAQGNVTGDRTITAEFGLVEGYIVSFYSSNTSYGTVSQASIAVASGTEVSIVGRTITIDGTVITATANTGYAFMNWSRSSGNIVAPITSDVTFTANFHEATVFEVTIHPDQHGTISVDGTEITTTTTLEYEEGTLITLTAEPNDGYWFQEWQIHMLENDEFFYPTDYPDLEWVVDADYELTADFRTNSNRVTINVNNPLFGSVSQSEVYPVPYLTPISTVGNVLTIGNTTVTATPTAGNVFIRWNNAQGNITDDRTITAVFEPVSGYVVTFTVDDPTKGTVSQAAISGISSGAAINVDGNQVTINGTTVTATPREGYVFDHWTNTSGTVTQSRTITAYFVEGYVLPDVWWDNGYINGRVDIAFDYQESYDNYEHKMAIPLWIYNGEDVPPTPNATAPDGVWYFDQTEYLLEIKVQYHSKVTVYYTLYEGNTKLVENYMTLGQWSQFIISIDAQNSLVNFYGITKERGMDFTFMNYNVVYDYELLDYRYYVDKLTINDIYHEDNSTGEDTENHPRFQVVYTTTWLDTYGFVMVNPSLNIYTVFPEFDDIRLNLYSFAMYGETMTINGHTLAMDGSKIADLYYKEVSDPIFDPGTQDVIGHDDYYIICNSTDSGAIHYTPTLQNIYITWENITAANDYERMCYITFVEDNMTIRMGSFETGDLTISFTGVWYFTTSVYEPYTATEKSYAMNWDSLFNVNGNEFMLIFIGALVGVTALLSAIGGWRLELYDWAVVIGAGIITYMLIGAF